MSGKHARARKATSIVDALYLYSILFTPFVSHYHPFLSILYSIRNLWLLALDTSVKLVIMCLGKTIFVPSKSLDEVQSRRCRLRHARSARSPMLSQRQ